MRVWKKLDVERGLGSQTSGKICVEADASEEGAPVRRGKLVDLEPSDGALEALVVRASERSRRLARRARGARREARERYCRALVISVWSPPHAGVEETRRRARSTPRNLWEDFRLEARHKPPLRIARGRRKWASIEAVAVRQGKDPGIEGREASRSSCARRASRRASRRSFVPLGESGASARVAKHGVERGLGARKQRKMCGEADASDEGRAVRRGRECWPPA